MCPPSAPPPNDPDPLGDLPIKPDESAIVNSAELNELVRNDHVLKQYMELLTQRQAELKDAQDKLRGYGRLKLHIGRLKSDIRRYESGLARRQRVLVELVLAKELTKIRKQIGVP